MRSSFLNLKATYGFNEALPYEKLEFRKLDWTDKYGIEDMMPGEIWKLAMHLKDSAPLHADYMIRKMGLNPHDPIEVDHATKILIKKGLVDQKSPFNYSMWPQICLMIANRNSREY